MLSRKGPTREGLRTWSPRPITGYNAIAVDVVTATVEDNEFTLGVTATFGHDTTRILKLIIGKYWMYLDGVAVKLDAAPIIRNSRTLLPIRAIAEVTGSVVLWDARTRKVTVKRKDRMVELLDRQEHCPREWQVR